MWVIFEFIFFRRESDEFFVYFLFYPFFFNLIVFSSHSTIKSVS